jgi:hypothetical protein
MPNTVYACLERVVNMTRLYPINASFSHSFSQISKPYIRSLVKAIIQSPLILRKQVLLLPLYYYLRLDHSALARADTLIIPQKWRGRYSSYTLPYAVHIAAFIVKLNSSAPLKPSVLPNSGYRALAYYHYSSPLAPERKKNPPVLEVPVTVPYSRSLAKRMCAVGAAGSQFETAIILHTLGKSLPLHILYYTDLPERYLGGRQVIRSDTPIPTDLQLEYFIRSRVNYEHLLQIFRKRYDAFYNYTITDFPNNSDLYKLEHRKDLVGIGHISPGLFSYLILVQFLGRDIAKKIVRMAGMHPYRNRLYKWPALLWPDLRTEVKTDGPNRIFITHKFGSSRCVFPQLAPNIITQTKMISSSPFPLPQIDNPLQKLDTDDIEEYSYAKVYRDEIIERQLECKNKDRDNTPKEQRYDSRSREGERQTSRRNTKQANAQKRNILRTRGF